MVELRRATVDDLAVVLDIGDALTKEDAGKHAEAFNLDWVAQEGEAAYIRMLGDERHAGRSGCEGGRVSLGGGARAVDLANRTDGRDLRAVRHS